jgi:HEAT repeat protein
LEDEVLALLEDESPSNRIAAAYGLWRMNPSRQEGPTTLFALLDSTQGSLLEESIRAVGRMGRDAAPAIHSLVERLKDEDARIRRIAAWAIGEVGPAATVAQEELRRIAEHDTDATAKDAARRALTVVVPDESIPDLVEALGEDNEYRRLEAATTLGRIGRDAAAAVPALVVAVEDRRIAEDGEFRGPSQHETLARARLAAAWALGEIGLDGRNVISVLTRVADDVRENAAIREAAGNAMGRLRGATERGATEQSETESDHDNQWGR